MDVLTLSRQDIVNEFQVNLATGPEDSSLDFDLGDEYLADPDRYMREKEEEEIKNLNFHFRRGTLTPKEIRRAKTLGLSWAENYIDPNRR
jgi:hypothetical protein